MTILLCFDDLQPGPRDLPHHCLIKRSKKTSTFYLYLALTSCKYCFGKMFFSPCFYRWLKINYEPSCMLSFYLPMGYSVDHIKSNGICIWTRAGKNLIGQMYSSIFSFLTRQTLLVGHQNIKELCCLSTFEVTSVHIINEN